jgi:thiamine kinase-like enzyme
LCVEANSKHNVPQLCHSDSVYGNFVLTFLHATRLVVSTIRSAHQRLVCVNMFTQ